MRPFPAGSEERVVKNQTFFKGISHTSILKEVLITWNIFTIYGVQL
ncbi:MAG: hypothetical protein LBR79_01500 [Oscillospiraceae bacterium]|nr:hypothetical protein [Oscillospiraceae bacterium]